MDELMFMSHTIDDFRSFFQEDKEMATFLVGETINKALELVSGNLECCNIHVEINSKENVSTIGYQNEYSQALLNIISNARSACIERCVVEPRIVIRITSESGRSVVCISDNCGGIPNEIMPKIFDPYFTTRGPDKGTGIGLYMSKVIIEQRMGGHLTVRNINDGAEFRIEV